jgi:hypothetical protein
MNHAVRPHGVVREKKTVPVYVGAVASRFDGGLLARASSHSRFLPKPRAELTKAFFPMTTIT